MKVCDEGVCDEAPVAPSDEGDGGGPVDPDLRPPVPEAVLLQR